MINYNQDFNHYAMIWLISHDNPKLREEAELKLMDVTKTNDRFSIEYFYAYFAVPNKPVALLFIPGTISYIDYGSEVVVVPKFDEQVSIKMQYNIENSISTYGLVAANDVNQTLPAEFRKRIMVTGFQTTHVMEIRAFGY